MTQQELRDAGELYDNNYDPEICALMDRCKDRCQECITITAIVSLLLVI